MRHYRRDLGTIVGSGTDAAVRLERLRHHHASLDRWRPHNVRTLPLPAPGSPADRLPVIGSRELTASATP